MLRNWAIQDNIALLPDATPLAVWSKGSYLPQCTGKQVFPQGIRWEVVHFFSETQNCNILFPLNFP
jgi:hypothetical protein